MLICPAEGCGVRVKSDRALTGHLKTCKKAKAGLASVSTEVKRREDDYRQAKRRKISSSEHLEIAPEVTEPMDVDLEVRSVEKVLVKRTSHDFPGWWSNHCPPTTNRRTSPAY